MVGDELEGLISFVEVDTVDVIPSTLLSLSLSLSLSLEDKRKGLLMGESEGKVMFIEEWMGWSSYTNMLVGVGMTVMVFILLS